MDALVFCNGTLYAWAVQTLVRIDPASGAATPVGNVGFLSSGDLSCASTGGEPFLYGTARRASGTDQLVRIDPRSGAGTLVGDTGQTTMLGLATVGSVTFGARSSGSLLQLFTLNPITGEATLIAQRTPTDGMFGMTQTSYY